MNDHTRELVRYVINGLIATALHFVILTFNLKILQLSSAGMANLLAAAGGITASFLGNRIFVFTKLSEPLVAQAIKFSGVYIVIALLHGLVLLIWTDCLNLDYKPGFLLATALQVSIGYFGNKFMVFKV